MKSQKKTSLFFGICPKHKEKWDLSFDDKEIELTFAHRGSGTMETGKQQHPELMSIRGGFREVIPTENDESLLASLSDAIARHKRERGNLEAKMDAKPIGELRSARVLDTMGVVAGYRDMKLSNVVGRSDEELKRLLNESLSELEFSRIHYELVWAYGKVMVFYIEGSEVLGDG